jgi:hypothetical protein
MPLFLNHKKFIETSASRIPCIFILRMFVKRNERRRVLPQNNRSD